MYRYEWYHDGDKWVRVSLELEVPKESRLGQIIVKFTEKL